MNRTKKKFIITQQLKLDKKNNKSCVCVTIFSIQLQIIDKCKINKTNPNQQQINID